MIGSIGTPRTLGMLMPSIEAQLPWLPRRRDGIVGVGRRQLLCGEGDGQGSGTLSAVAVEGKEPWLGSAKGTAPLK